MIDNIKYPSKEEYLKNIDDIQNKELNSTRYKMVYEFLNKNYWKRKNIDLEDKLFEIINKSNDEENILDCFDNYKKELRCKRYNDLKQFINSLNKSQIESNIFLNNAYEFIKLSTNNCLDILCEFNRNIYNSESNTLTLSIPVTNRIDEYILSHVNRLIGIRYYDPNVYKVSYIDVLDDEHKYVYNDYEEYIRKTQELISKIYYLELNNILDDTNLSCYGFNIYNDNFEKKFIINLMKKKEKVLKRSLYE